MNTNGNLAPPEKKFRPCQIRWAEPLGNKACPYAHRWTLCFPWFSIRLHHWLKTEDSRNMHDHPWGFVTLVLWGGYADVTDIGGERFNYAAGKRVHYSVLHRDLLSFLSIRARPATHRHYVEVNKGGCWTVLVTGPVVRNWGYWVKGKLKRPMRYFGKFGHPPCEN